MLRLKQILFPTDFSENSEAAIPHIARFVSNFDSELHILNAPRKEIQSGQRAKVEEHMVILGRKIAERAGKPVDKLKIKTAVMRGIAPAPVINDYARDHNIDLILLATHGRRGIQRFFLGSVAEEIARLAPCDVLTVRAKLGGDDNPPYHNILVPIDFSGYSKTALVYAHELAQRFGCQVHLLNVLEEDNDSIRYATGRRSLFEAAPDLREKTMEGLKALSKALNIPAGHVHVRQGRIPVAIDKLVKSKDIDLMVIAAHSRPNRRMSPLGSVTQMVIHHASCPVFTLRNFGRSRLV